MKVALLTDTHFGARNDSLIFHEYFRKFYHDIFFPTLKERNIDTIIHLGDVFDRRKFINYNILQKVYKDVFDVIRDNGINMHIIVGNHDTYFKNTNDVNSVDLLLDRYDNIEVYSEAQDVNVHGRDILFVPWINSDNEDQTLKTIKKSHSVVAMGHLELSGFLMSAGVVNDHGLSKKVFDKFDKVYTGHFHHKSTDGNVTYIGNEYEITWIDYADQRGFHIFDTETCEIEFIPNPYTMFNKVFYNDVDKTLEDILGAYNFDDFTDRYIKVIVETKSNPYFFDKFMEEMYRCAPAHMSVVEDIVIEGAEDEDVAELAEDTMTVLERYVDEMDIDSNKKVLKNMLKQLYLESLELEVA